MDYKCSNGEVGFAPDEQLFYAQLEGQYKSAKADMDQVLNRIHLENRKETPEEAAEVERCVASLNDVLFTLENNHISFTYDDDGCIYIYARHR